MLCAVCRRDARGLGFSPRLIGLDAPTVKLCSMRCMDIAARFRGMINPNVHETAALHAASAAGGAFIEAMPSADLSTWSAEDWHRLIDVIVTGFQDSLRAAYADDPPI
jgi:hypothetical protein